MFSAHVVSGFSLRVHARVAPTRLTDLTTGRQVSGMTNVNPVACFGAIHFDKLYIFFDLIMEDSKVLIIFSAGFPDASLSSKTFRTYYST